MTNAVPVRYAEGQSGAWFKWHFQCGACPATFKARLPKMNHPTVRCPSCGAWNRVNVVVDDGLNR